MKTTNRIYGIALALTCSLAGMLKAQDIYVVNYGNNTIGEYTTSGGTVNTNLISGLYEPEGIAISGNDLFIGNGTTSGYISEYTTSGAAVNTNLISGLNNPTFILISGNDLFVADAGSGTIGEYTLSGATVNASLISGLHGPNGIAISGNDLFVANNQNNTVGEYTLTGSTVNASLISGLHDPQGIAISGTNLFVANYGSFGAGTGIGEYTLSGATVNATLITGVRYPIGLSVLGTNLFVVNELNGTIGEYTTSGATVNTNLLSGLNIAECIAISPVPSPAPPRFMTINVNGSTLSITGTNGPAGGSYTLLKSTNLALPLTQWTRVLTNTFATNSSLNLSTNIVSKANPAEFYILEVP